MSCFPQRTFEKTLVPGTSNAVVQTLDGGFVMTGWQGSYVMLVKADSLGNLIWSKTYGDVIGMTSGNKGYDVICLSDGGFLICGFYNPSTAVNDVYFIRTNSIGDTLWTKHYHSPFLTTDKYYFYEVRQTTSNEYIAAGQIEYDSTQPFDIAMMKLDSSGNMIWHKELDLGKKEIFTGLAITDSNYVIIGESYFVSSPIHDHFILRTDTAGNETFSKLYSQSPCCDEITDLLITNDSNYVVIGSHNDSSGFYIDLFKFGYSGDTIQYNSIPMPYQTIIPGFFKHTNGFIIYGYKRQSFADDALLIKVDQDGNEMWRRIFGGSGNDNFYNGILTADSMFALTGWSSSFGSSTVYLVKTDTLGQIMTNINTINQSFAPFTTHLTDVNQIVISCNEDPCGPFDLKLYNSLMQNVCSSSGYELNTDFAECGMYYLEAIDKKDNQRYILKILILQ